MHQPIHSDSAPKAIGPYSQAIRAGTTVYLSGQIPLIAATGQLIEGDVAAQTRQVMDNLAAVLFASGLTFHHVVKATLYVIDLADFATINTVYGERFSGHPPARSTVQVAALPRGARIEIDLIAVG